jgi:hypothetical protein
LFDAVQHFIGSLWKRLGTAMKEALDKSFQVARISNRHWSRSPNDTVAPDAPEIGVPQAPSATEVTVPWTYGKDDNTGVTAAFVEIRETGAPTWTQAIVAYPTNVYTFTGLNGSTSYETRVANQDGAPTPNVSAYSSTATIVTPPTVAQLAPGQVSITTSAVTVLEGGAINIAVARTGAGTSAPSIEADWAFLGFPAGVLIATGKFSWTGTDVTSRTATATAGAVSANITGTFQITAVRALSGTINPSLGTSSIAVTIQDQPVTGSILRVGTGQPYTTIAAALAAVQAGQTIELYNGTYNEVIVTARAGTQAQPITIRAAAGQSPVVTGISTVTGQQACAHLLHNYWDAGQGIELRGTNTGSSNSFDTATPSSGVHYADGVINVTNRFIERNMRVDFVRTGSASTVANNRLVRPRFVGMDCRVAGTLLVNGVTPVSDSGEGLNLYESNSCDYPLIESCYFQMGGGHASARISGNNGLVTGCLFDQDWSSIFGANKGQKTLSTSIRTRGVIEDTMCRNSGRQLDSNPSTSMVRTWGANTLHRRLFLLHAMDTGVGAFSADNTEAPGGSDLRYAHITVHDFTACAFDFHGEGTGSFGPFYLKNCLFSSCVSGPTYPQTQQPYVISLRYKSTVTPDWKTLLFVTNCAFDSNYSVRIFDIDGVVGTIIRTVTQAQIDFPNNFSRNVVAAPNFVSTTLPTTTDPATALSQCNSRFVPQSASVVDAGGALTTLAATVNASTVMQLTDAKWFRDPMGWSHLTGDAIYIQGVGSRVITNITGNIVTVDSTVTAAVGANIYLGSNATPNIGAVL